MPAVVLLDTGPLVAMTNRNDACHEWAREQLTRLHEPLVTCGAVLAETGFLLRLAPLPLARIRTRIERGEIVPVPETAALWQRAFALMERYANVPMSFADACLVAMAEREPEACIFTLDQDFLIYRRADDQPLTLIAPFAG